MVSLLALLLEQGLVLELVVELALVMALVMAMLLVSLSLLAMGYLELLG